MTRKPADTAPSIYTAEGDPGTVEVRLAFLQRTGVGTDRGPVVSLAVSDPLSGQTVVEVELTAAQFTGLLGGGQTVVKAECLLHHPERLGRRMQCTSTEIDYADLPVGAKRAAFDARAAEVRNTYRADDWETVEIEHTNYGRRVVAYRWVDA
jgi:hypothetical protein